MLWHIIEGIGYGILAALCVLGIGGLILAGMIALDVFNGKNPFQ